jgi:hypothetical protein
VFLKLRELRDEEHRTFDSLDECKEVLNSIREGSSCADSQHTKHFHPACCGRDDGTAFFYKLFNKKKVKPDGPLGPSVQAYAVTAASLEDLLCSRCNPHRSAQLTGAQMFCLLSQMQALVHAFLRAKICTCAY